MSQHRVDQLFYLLGEDDDELGQYVRSIDYTHMFTMEGTILKFSKRNKQQLSIDINVTNRIGMYEFLNQCNTALYGRSYNWSNYSVLSKKLLLLDYVGRICSEPERAAMIYDQLSIYLTTRTIPSKNVIIDRNRIIRIEIPRQLPEIKKQPSDAPRFPLIIKNVG